MAARILRAIAIVKDSDEDEKMGRNSNKEEEEEGRQSVRQRCAQELVHYDCLSTHAQRRRDAPSKIIISLVKLHKRS